MGYGWSIAQQTEIAFRVSQWKLDDLMRIEWNSNYGTFKYYVNDIEEGTMSIEKGLAYCPCAGTQGNAVEVEIM